MSQDIAQLIVSIDRLAALVGQRFVPDLERLEDLCGKLLPAAHNDERESWEPTPRLLKQEEAARYCNVSVATFKKLVISKHLPGMVNGVSRWCLQELDSAIDKMSGKAKKREKCSDEEHAARMRKESDERILRATQG